MPKFVLPVSKEDYEASGSKFINVGFDLTNLQEAAKHLGQVFYRKIECQMIDWDTPNKSMKVTTIVTEGEDTGHEEKLSFGIDKSGIWKGKQIYKSITGKEMEFEKGRDGVERPVIDSDDISGKPAVGVWTVLKGTAGGKEGAAIVYYPKMTSIYPADFKQEGEGKDLI